MTLFPVKSLPFLAGYIEKPETAITEVRGLGFRQLPVAPAELIILFPPTVSRIFRSNRTYCGFQGYGQGFLLTTLFPIPDQPDSHIPASLRFFISTVLTPLMFSMLTSFFLKMSLKIKTCYNKLSILCPVVGQS